MRPTSINIKTLIFATILVIAVTIYEVYLNRNGQGGDVTGHYIFYGVGILYLIWGWISYFRKK